MLLALKHPRQDARGNSAEFSVELSAEISAEFSAEFPSLSCAHCLRTVSPDGFGSRFMRQSKNQRKNVSFQKLGPKNKFGGAIFVCWE